MYKVYTHISIIIIVQILLLTMKTVTIYTDE